MVEGWFGYNLPGSAWIAPLIGTAIFVRGGRPFLTMAKDEIRAKSPGMMTLISLAITVAFLASAASTLGIGELDFWWELAALIVVMLLGHWQEMKAVGQAQGALAALAELLPDDAERLTGDDETEHVSISDLDEGDTVVVRPGGRIPADGTIIRGDAAVDESMITGESASVSKSKGDSVVAGTVATNSSLRIKVTATGDGTALAGIQRMVIDAQESKSGTRMLADRAAVDGRQVAVGGPALLESLHATLPDSLDDAARTWRDNGGAVLHVVVDGEVVGAFTTSDPVRPESKAAVDALHARGINVAMITGDSQAVAGAVAKQLGIDDVFAEVLPEDKDKAVGDLQDRGKRVAMVGDGVNDAPGVVLAGSDPRAVLGVITLSRVLQEDAPEPRVGHRLQRDRDPARGRRLRVGRTYAAARLDGRGNEPIDHRSGGECAVAAPGKPQARGSSGIGTRSRFV